MSEEPVNWETNLEKAVREALIYSSPRRKPGAGALILLDSGFRRNDIFAFDQRFLSHGIHAAKQIPWTQGTEEKQ